MITREHRPAIGIVALASSYPKLVGNMANRASFEYPVVYRTADIRPGWWLETERRDAHLAAFLSCARELEDLGVRAITTTCGLFAVFQRVAAQALSVPVFTTPLSLIPLVSVGIGPSQRVGVVTAAGERIRDESFLTNAGVDPCIPIAVAAVDQCSEFLQTIRYERKPTLDSDGFRDQLTVEVARMLDEHPDVGALVFECSDIPMYSSHIAKVTGLPVFDFIALTNLVYQALAPASFS